MELSTGIAPGFNSSTLVPSTSYFDLELCKLSLLGLTADSAHVNTCNSFFSLIKRGVYGSFHHVSKHHLPKYCNEFAFRWNHRNTTDGQRMAKAIESAKGKRLTYRQAV